MSGHLRAVRSPAPISDLIRVRRGESCRPAGPGQSQSVFTRQIGTGWDPPADNSSSFFPVSRDCESVKEGPGLNQREVKVNP